MNYQATLETGAPTAAPAPARLGAGPWIILSLLVVDDKGNCACLPTSGPLIRVLDRWAAVKDGGTGSKEMHMVYASPERQFI
jgi:hypothetical protein